MTECEYYQQLISQRLDGELTAAQEHELAEHLSRCADCRAVDAAFRALSEALPTVRRMRPQISAKT